jgi:hypothetical protein
MNKALIAAVVSLLLIPSLGETLSAMQSTKSKSDIEKDSIHVCADRGKRGKKGSRGERGRRGLIGTTGLNGATGPIGPTGAAGASGPIGPIGPTGPTAGLNAFASAIVTGAPLLTIHADTDVDWTTTPVLSNIGFIAPSTFTIASSGVYEISYGAVTTVSLLGALEIWVNGVAVVPSTRIGALVGTGEFSGTFMLSLTAGDTVTLHNSSLVDLTLDLNPLDVAAFITINKLN